MDLEAISLTSEEALFGVGQEIDAFLKTVP